MGVGAYKAADGRKLYVVLFSVPCAPSPRRPPSRLPRPLPRPLRRRLRPSADRSTHAEPSATVPAATPEPSATPRRGRLTDGRSGLFPIGSPPPRPSVSLRVRDGTPSQGAGRLAVQAAVRRVVRLARLPPIRRRGPLRSYRHAASRSRASGHPAHRPGPRIHRGRSASGRDLITANGNGHQRRIGPPLDRQVGDGQEARIGHVEDSGSSIRRWWTWTLPPHVVVCV